MCISDRGNPHCFGTHAIMTDTSLTPANINPSMTFVWLCNVSIEDYFTVFSFESLFSVSYYILWEIIDYLTDFEMKTKINKHLKLIWFFWGGTLVKFLEQIKRGYRWYVLLQLFRQFKSNYVRRLEGLVLGKTIFYRKEPNLT